MLSKTEKRRRCSGCHDEYYHSHVEGGCYSLKNARAAHLLVYYHTNNVKRILRKDSLDCWHNFAYGMRCNAKGVPLKEMA